MKPTFAPSACPARAARRCPDRTHAAHAVHARPARPSPARLAAGLLAAALAALALPAARAADIALYETGPAEDSSFIRFVNGGREPLEVEASGSKARVELPADRPATDFLPIRAGAPIGGTLAGAGGRHDVSVTVQPGEFVSIVGVPGPGREFRIVTVRELPDDFNALKASVAFYNLDGGCADAALLAAGRNVVLFDKVPQGESARRQVNPVALQVQLSCAGQPAGPALDLGALEAGQRYTVFLVPSEDGPRIFQATDALAR